MLWLQGWERAPRLVRACRRSWEILNPAWTIRALDRFSAQNFIDDPEARAVFNALDQPPEACSDRIRIALLEKHGGVWVDATAYCLRPLDDWLFDVLASGFFGFDRPTSDRLISSWFLAAPPGHYITRRWLELTLDYWRERTSRHDYFWFHNLFGDECRNNPGFRAMYDQIPKISADGPHYYVPQATKLWAPATEKDVHLITQPTLPLLKLAHKLPSEDYPAASVAEYVCERLGC